MRPPPTLRVLAVHAPLGPPLLTGGLVIYETSVAPDEPRVILLYPVPGAAAMHAIVMPLWAQPPTPEAIARLRGLGELRSATAVAGLLRDARSADPVRRALAQRAVFEAYGESGDGGEWRPNGMAVSADPRPTPLLDLDEMLGRALAAFAAPAAPTKAPRPPALALTADDRSRVRELAYGLRYGHSDAEHSETVRLRSGVSVDVSLSDGGKRIDLTQRGGPQHGKVTRLPF